MLLQRLKEHANNGRDDEVDEPVPPFYSRRPVRWIIDIDSHGELTSPQLTQVFDPSDKNRNARQAATVSVPDVTRTVAIAPKVGVDTIEYVLGWQSQDPKHPQDDKKRARIASSCTAFRALQERWAQADPDGPAAAIVKFYQTGQHEKLACADVVRSDGTVKQSWSGSDLVAFHIDGELACETPSAQRFWAGVARERKGSGNVGTCMVCAEYRPLLKTIPHTIPKRLVPGLGQNASLVSVNKNPHGFGLRTSLVHTPICEDCGLAVMNGLRAVLDDSEHSTTSGDSTMAWWVVGDGDVDLAVLSRPEDHLDDVSSMISAAHDSRPGSIDLDLGVLCALTVSGASARVIVRDWIEMPLHTVRTNLGEWFDDIAVVYGAQVRYPGVGALAWAAGRWKKATSGDDASGGYVRFGDKGADRPDGIYRSLLSCALFGRPLPPNLLKHVVHRIRRDGRIDHLRASLVQLGLRRLYSYKDLNMTDQDDPAYIAGRLFAVYEQLQWKSLNPTTLNKGDKAVDVNTTFYDKHYAGAITNPARACAAGERNVPIWLRRLRRDNPASATYLSKLVSELNAALSNAGGASSFSTLLQQGLFISGYHHQRQARFTKEQKPNDEGDNS